MIVIFLYILKIHYQCTEYLGLGIWYMISIELGTLYIYVCMTKYANIMASHCKPQRVQM